MRDDLRQWVGKEMASDVVAAAPLGNGASRRTWSVDLDDGRTVVVREDTGTGPVAGTPLTLGREALVYRALAQAPVPVPTLLAVSPDGQALLFERAKGTEDLKSASDDERRAIACDYGRCLGRLHASDLDLASLEWDDIAVWQSILDSRCREHATTASRPALAWLADHVPDAKGRSALCHGDAGPGNFLREQGTVTALLDWEFAHVGDALDDLAWVAVRNRLLGRPLALVDVFAGWRDACGFDIDVDALEYYRALVLVRMAISCDAALEWTGGATTPETRVQAALKPFLAPALLEALRRAGCTEPFVDDLETAAHAEWDRSPIAAVLGDPSDLDNFDDLGAL